jgi:hypothetical protein
MLLGAQRYAQPNPGGNQQSNQTGQAFLNLHRRRFHRHAEISGG